MDGQDIQVFGCRGWICFIEKRKMNIDIQDVQDILVGRVDLFHKKNKKKQFGWGQAGRSFVSGSMRLAKGPSGGPARLPCAWEAAVKAGCARLGPVCLKAF